VTGELQPDQPEQADQLDMAAGGAAPAAGRPPSSDDGYTGRLLAVVMLAVMGFGSLMTIVTVSLSTIADDLGTSRATLGWVVTGLMLAMAVATPLAGKLGDIRGHRRVFLWGLGAGVVTTALCAVAWDAGSLITFRVLFGLSGALVMPNGMSLVMRAYGPERRATAMGWFQFAMTGAPTVGLVIGGPLIDVIGWRPIFVAFALVSVVALVMGAALVRESPRQQRVPLDVAGALALGGAVLCGLLAVTQGAGAARSDGLAGVVTDRAALLLAVGSALSLALFIRIESRAPHPMLQLRYFRRRSFTTPLAASALTQFAYMGGFVVVPLLLDDVYGWTVGGIALIMAPRPGAFSVSAPLGGHLASRWGERRPMLLGAALMIGSMLAFAGSSGGGALALIVVGLVLSGVAAGFIGPSSTAMVAGAVDEADMGIANGMSQQVLFVGIVSGIQVMLVLVGDDPTTGQFSRTFLFGALVAVLGLGAAWAARRPGRGDNAAPAEDMQPLAAPAAATAVGSGH
jgi:EmrB/QacA subfamily drug resistance transporter